uniref:Putative secreted protein n=1 Tax=Anopheles triannulatus TaxID=58253 RepID=A0A2M4B1U4_9DIPT
MDLLWLLLLLITGRVNAIGLLDRFSTSYRFQFLPDAFLLRTELPQLLLQLTFSFSQVNTVVGQVLIHFPQLVQLANVRLVFDRDCVQLFENLAPLVCKQFNLFH